MKIPKLNWALWAGLLLSLVAFISYPLFFARFPLTRDFPWANLVLAVVTLGLLLIGIRRAFATDRPRRSRIAGIAVPLLSVAFLGMFIFMAFILARWLPASKGAPQVGQKAPEFSLADSDGKQTTLAELTSTPIDGGPVKGVLLIFYRGYW
jgi:hypothetical protein